MDDSTESSAIDTNSQYRIPFGFSNFSSLSNSIESTEIDAGKHTASNADDDKLARNNKQEHPSTGVPPWPSG